MEFDYLFDEVDMARYLFYSPNFNKKYRINRVMMFVFSLMGIAGSLMLFNQALVDHNEPPAWGEPLPFACSIIPLLFSLLFLITAILLRRLIILYISCVLKRKGDPYGTYGKIGIQTIDDCYRCTTDTIDQYISWMMVKGIRRQNGQITIDLRNGTRTIIPEDSIQGDFGPDEIFKEFKGHLQDSRAEIGCEPEELKVLDHGSYEGLIMEFHSRMDNKEREAVISGYGLERINIRKYQITLTSMGILAIVFGIIMIFVVLGRDKTGIEDIIDIVLISSFSLIIGIISMGFGLLMKRIIKRSMGPLKERWKLSESDIQVFSLHDWGLRRRNKMFDTSYTWDIVEGLDETQDHLFFLLPKKNFLTVSKKEAGKDTIDRIKPIVEKYTSSDH